MTSAAILVVLYLLAAFCEFLAPYDPHKMDRKLFLVPPQAIRFRDENGFRSPFLYGIKQQRDPVTFRSTHAQVLEETYPIRFLAKGDPYKLWGLFESDIHLIGTEGNAGPLHLVGTDLLGRDLLSRSLYGARVSLAIGLIGAAICLIVGSLLDGMLGYYWFVFGIPSLILREVSMAFLGLGLIPSAISWGGQLQDVQNLRLAIIAPWLFSPCILVVLTVLSFSFVGKGLRAALDVPSPGDSDKIAD